MDEDEDEDEDLKKTYTQSVLVVQASARRVWHGTQSQVCGRLIMGHTLCDPLVFGKHRLPQAEYLRANGAEGQEVEEPHGKPLRSIQ